VELKDQTIEKYSKIIGLVFLFLGMALLLIVFFLAYLLFTNPEGMLPSMPGTEGETSAILTSFFKVSIILGAKWMALSILGLVGSWVCNKGIMLIKTPKK
jgi:hypothetical protein